ncbi:hypothetical protein [Mesorhizobium sp.]|uniref:hypothetical protein n=1 Tax=Mesorhizobium sp. TaxID=1871066 RepID=UPI000FE8D2FB|nr:hypothetical protein [Mesorhizobium sp.]RWG42970.1 MAG: hypothetical protein EOQ62_25045 [Mesorhizobium sp.]RWI28739.1 MAG: hypothetical protein EOQ92_05740 [Mesorhizobium sp.]RWK45485.1 MAG: hypothetical protein EOR47_30700 [Mesorhizobium sp.]RWK91714.1 MAG: hypothetical protein EOR53_28380 [Mesorhizobium sp.]TIP58002.1 MAG: hypothetical protein E5X56_17370 [Mesorhizobium sp.]
MITEIEQRLASRDDLILKVQQTVAETLGDTLPISMAVRFDSRLARSSLQVYDLRTVPAIRDGIPAEVSHVHFRSNLSSVAPLSVAQIEALTCTGRDLLPG